MGAKYLAGACLGPAWGLLGACLGPAWGLLGACLGSAWGLLAALLANCPGREAPSGGRTPFGGKSPGWGLLGALGPAQGPVRLSTPRGGQRTRGQKPLGLGFLPLYAACIRYGYLWHCRGKAGSGPASPGPMRDALLGRSLSARTASGSPGWVTSPQLDFRVCASAAAPEVILAEGAARFLSSITPHPSRPKSHLLTGLGLSTSQTPLSRGASCATQ